jgi:hypothetical protein
MERVRVLGDCVAEIRWVRHLWNYRLNEANKKGDNGLGNSEMI